MARIDNPIDANIVQNLSKLSKHIAITVNRPGSGIPFASTEMLATYLPVLWTKLVLRPFPPEVNTEIGRSINSDCKLSSVVRSLVHV